MTEDKKSEAAASKKTDKPDTQSNNNKNIVIAVLATALTCVIITIAVLLCTGVIKFGASSGVNEQEASKISHHNKNDGEYKHGDDILIDNPYDRVKVDGNLVEVDDLEFYLPYAFEAGGKNNDGAYTYNLTDDDGWAQVLVYAEKSSLSPEKFLNKISPYLDVTDDDYEINGTEWVQAENASALAYATKLNGKIYAVYYSVKLDSEATGKAMQMIPKTLYMKKIEAE